VVNLVFAAQSQPIGAVGIVMAFGFVIGVFGHIIRSRTLIITGILVVAVASGYFGIVVAKVR
jgi:hypothetical protein